MYSSNRKNKTAWKKGYYSWWDLPITLDDESVKQLNAYYSRAVTPLLLTQNKQVQQILLHQYHSTNTLKSNVKKVFLGQVMDKTAFDKSTRLIDIKCPNCNGMYQ